MLWIWIRIWSDQKLLAGSGSEKHHSGSGQLWIRNEFEKRKEYSGKLIKFDYFSRKMVNLKLQVPFYQKNFPNKLIQYIVIVCNLTHLQDGNTKEKFMLRILEKINVGSETNWKVRSGSRPEKNHSGSTTLLETLQICHLYFIHLHSDDKIALKSNI